MPFTKKGQFNSNAAIREHFRLMPATTGKLFDDDYRSEGLGRNTVDETAISYGRFIPREVSNGLSPDATSMEVVDGLTAMYSRLNVCVSSFSPLLF